MSTTNPADHEIPRDEIADRVLDHLVSGLSADDERPGDEAMIARSVDRVVARRLAAAHPPPRLARPTPRAWVPLAAAAALTAAAAMALLATRDEPAASPGEPRAADDSELLEPERSASPAPSVPEEPRAADDPLPTLDVGSLPTAPSPPTREAPSRTVETRTAAELFALANDARRTRDIATARALYLELQRRYPRSAEASTSFVTLGRLELDHARAAPALAQYDRYLASGAVELREDALAGRASALEALGRTADEKQAWEALLAEHPSSLFAPHARRRVGAIP